MRLIHLLQFCALAVTADAQCYLMDANAKCAVCWTTTYFAPDDKIGVTTMAECPSTITAHWSTALPEKMYEGSSYPVKYGAHVETEHNVQVHAKTQRTVAHANIHSCIASRGACTPFVSNTVGLATHTEAKKGDFDSNGDVEFESEVKLTKDIYTIIAHVRFFVPNKHDATLPPSQVNVAIGVTREVLAEVREVSQDSYIMTGVLGAAIIITISAVIYASRKGIVDFDRVIEVIYGESVICSFEILIGLGDVAAFTVCVFTVVTVDNQLIQVLPACFLFMALAWLGSVYNAYHDAMQLYNVFVEHYRETSYVDIVALRHAKELIKRQRKLLADGGAVFLQDPKYGGADGLILHVRKLCNEHTKYDALLELEMASRDLRRKRGDIITLVTESIPITAIQAYILGAADEIQVITIAVLFFSSAVFGAKVAGLGTYKQCRNRRDAAEERFESVFHVLELDRLASVASNFDKTASAYSIPPGPPGPPGAPDLDARRRRRSSVASTGSVDLGTVYEHVRQQLPPPPAAAPAAALFAVGNAPPYGDDRAPYYGDAPPPAGQFPVWVQHMQPTDVVTTHMQPTDVVTTTLHASVGFGTPRTQPVYPQYPPNGGSSNV